MCLPPPDVECAPPLRRVCSPVVGGEFCRCQAPKIVPLCTVEISFAADTPSEPVVKADPFCDIGAIEGAVGTALARLLLGQPPAPR